MPKATSLDSLNIANASIYHFPVNVANFLNGLEFNIQVLPNKVV